MEKISNEKILRYLRAIAAGRFSKGGDVRKTSNYSRDEMMAIARIACREAGVTQWQPDDKVTR